MIDDKILDEMVLPLSDSQEELSIISENKFKPLFDVTKFLIRSENERDKGIDFHIEIKIKNRDTNFRFVIQLKATDSKLINKDKSISLQLYTSNINYLLNNPMPAFYVLYHKNTNAFYYESIHDFAKALYDKDINWSSQPSHVLRFTKKLDSIGIDEMYQLTLTRGKFQRTVNEKAVLQSISINSGDKVLVDSDFNISDDSEIRQLVESIGFELINEGKWKEIIEVHKKASGNVASTAKYNLVLGVANYYSCNLTESLSFFKNTHKLESELSKELIEHLKFFETTVKYSIGILSDSEYIKKMEDLENADNIGLFIKLEKAKRDFIELSNTNSKDRYDKYYSDIQNIFNDPKASTYIKLNAKCDLVLFEGSKNNMEYVKNVSIINALEGEIGPNSNLRIDAVKRLQQAYNNWFKNVQILKTEAFETNNYFAYFAAITNEVKVIYEFDVFTDNVFVVQEIPNISIPQKPDKKPRFDRMLNKISKAYDFYNKIGHIENLIATLYIKYELLHYLNELDSANQTISELEELINAYDLNDYKKRLDFLKNEGTTHQSFKHFMDKIFGESKSKREEYRIHREEMIKMDEIEKNVKNKALKDSYQINLVPIGIFVFPKKDKHKVYDILNITLAAREMFDKMFEIVIPVANINHNPITKEGFAEDLIEDNVFESWKNIYRIRKCFFENCFYRYEF